MVDNRHRGEVSLLIGDATMPLVYTWDAISRLQHRWPAGDYQPTQVDDLAEMIAIGLRHHWPDVTAAKVAAMSPPFYPAIVSVNTALCRAFHGTDEPVDPNPPQPGVLATLSSWLSGRAAQWGWRRRSFGV